jgi:diacylglycerol kinase (ATP)
MVDVAIIHNPLAGSKKKSRSDIEYASECLDNLKVSYKIKDGYQVIGAGGDGTCNEVLHGVISSKSGALCGFIPMGSGNDVPAVIGILPDIKRACEIIAEGHTAKSDVGLATKDDGSERYFLGVGSQGFDSEVARRANENKEKNYNALVLKVFFGWKNKKVKVIMDNDTYEGEAILVAVGNGGSYGAGMYICQKAKVDDGLFDITIANVKKLKLLFQFKKTLSASLLPYPNIYEYQSRKVRIEMLNPDDESYLCQVDGEMLGELPVTYETIKDGQEFIRPKTNEFAEAFKEKYGHYYWECDH